MTELTILDRIIENFKANSLKDSLLKEHVGTKKFYGALKKYPDKEQEFKEICKQKKAKIKRSKKSFSEDLLKQIVEEYSRGERLDTLAKKYKTSPLVIKRELTIHGIPLRTSEDIAKIQRVKKCSIKEDQMWLKVYEEYLNSRALHKVAKKFHTTSKKLVENFERLELPLLKEVRLKPYSTTDGVKMWSDKEYWENVYRYYLEHSISNVSEKFGVERRRLYHIFRLYGWKVRTRKEESSFRLIKNGLESFNRLMKELKEFEVLEEFRGYTKDGKFIQYTFKHKKCGRTFKRTLHDLTNMRCLHCHPKSEAENFIGNFIKEYTIVENNRRDVIPPQELDIFLPEYNIAIEYNGRYWHNELYVEKNYHANKTEECLKKGIKLVHFWEGWDRAIIESRLSQLIKQSNQIYARNTKVEEVTVKERREFFNKCHIGGDTSASFALGLYFESVLVSCMSFRKNKEGLELARFACALNTNVVGGFSKLFKASLKAIRNMYPEVEKVITYCNRDWTPDYRDSVYYKNGFTFVKNSGPILSYYNSTLGVTESREKYQKHKLNKLFPEYNGENVATFLKAKGIYKMYNSGNWKFEWRLNYEN